jgi:hypothetical protein
MDILVYQLAYV